MRRLLLLIACLVLVGCLPEPEGKSIVSSLGEATDENMLTGFAVLADEPPRSCADDLECGVGRVCTNNTCTPKKR